jgi:hypothetical protein
VQRPHGGEKLRPRVALDAEQRMGAQLPEAIRGRGAVRRDVSLREPHPIVRLEPAPKNYEPCRVDQAIFAHQIGPNLASLGRKAFRCR